MAGPLFATRRLPDNLKLSDGQKTQIKSLMSSFRAAHRDDLESLAASMKQARAARTAGQTTEQRRALFAQTSPARQRLMAAHTQLAASVQQVLTADQRAWLSAHRPTFQRGSPRVRRTTTTNGLR
jgi:Spy/CpxP family protein refolding chaperone